MRIDDYQRISWWVTVSCCPRGDTEKTELKCAIPDLWTSVPLSEGPSFLYSWSQPHISGELESHFISSLFLWFSLRWSTAAPEEKNLIGFFNQVRSYVNEFTEELFNQKRFVPPILWFPDGGRPWKCTTSALKVPRAEHRRVSILEWKL